MILIAGVSGARAQDKKPELKDKRITIKMKNKMLWDVFMRLMYDYDVAIGFEESTLDSRHDDYEFEVNVPYDEPSEKDANGYPLNGSGGYPNDVKNHLMTVDFKDARLEDVMNDIVRQMKNYDWEINDEVVNIFPIRGRDPRFEKLLDLKISQFSIEKGRAVGIIQGIIIHILPEIKAFLAENNLYAEASRNAPWYIERPLPVGMKFSNLTFKELLNRITKKKRGGWILKRAKLGEEQDEGFIDIII